MLKKFKCNFRVFCPSKTNDWGRDSKIGSSAQELAVGLRFLSRAINVQKDNIVQAITKFRKRSFGAEDLTNAVAFCAQNFFQHVSESVVWVDEKNTLRIFQ